MHVIRSADTCRYYSMMPVTESVIQQLNQVQLAHLMKAHGAHHPRTLYRLQRAAKMEPSSPYLAGPVAWITTEAR
jgi:hypothetical protein